MNGRVLVPVAGLGLLMFLTSGWPAILHDTVWGYSNINSPQTSVGTLNPLPEAGQPNVPLPAPTNVPTVPVPNPGGGAPISLNLSPAPATTPAPAPGSTLFNQLFGG